MGAGPDRPDQKRGLLDIVARSKNDYQKRAYQCIKVLTALFTRCHPACILLTNNADIRSKWIHCVEWLQDELERVSLKKFGMMTFRENPL